MPYKDRSKDKQWHRDKMRERRTILKLNSRFVTPDVTPDDVSIPKIDADGNVIPDYD